MSRVNELIEKYNRHRDMLVQLQEAYKDKIKGEAYNTRFIQITQKMDYFKNQLRSQGTDGTIIKITGKISRISKRNPQLRVTQKFEVYLSNVTVEEVPLLIKLNMNNIVDYEIKQIKPGYIDLK